MTGLTKYRLRNCWCFKSRMAGIPFVSFWISQLLTNRFLGPITALEWMIQHYSNTPGETAGTVNQETRTASLGCFIAIRFVATASGFSVEIKCEWYQSRVWATFLHEIDWHVWLDLYVQEEGGILSLLWVEEIAGDEWRLAGTDRPDQEKHPSLTVSQCLNKRGLDQLQSLISVVTSILLLPVSSGSDVRFSTWKGAGPEKNFLIVNFYQRKLSVIVWLSGRKNSRDNLK